VQLVVLPISAAEEKVAADVLRQAVALGIRAEIAYAEEGTLNARIRENRHAPYQAIIGGREAAAHQIALRERGGQQVAPAPIEAVLGRILAEVAIS
jgi:threonyl-tRNA synthetase